MISIALSLTSVLAFVLFAQALTCSKGFVRH
jgi:hypothetical protein